MISSPADAARSTYQYSLSGPANHSETTTGEPGDTGLCSPVETITFQGRFTAHVAATQAGLSDEEVLAALNNNDPIVVRAHFIERGSFTLQAGGHTYTGRYVSSFGGQVNNRTMVFRGSFSATGKSDAGTQLVIHFSGHETFSMVRRGSARSTCRSRAASASEPRPSRLYPLPRSCGACQRGRWSARTGLTLRPSW
jgi:hypothetical protein